MSALRGSRGHLAQSREPGEELRVPARLLFVNSQ
jgi:hypothetical protein